MRVPAPLSSCSRTTPADRVAFWSRDGLSVETTYCRPAPGAEDRTVVDRLVRMVDDTPPGAQIRATVFRLTVEEVRDALVAAAARGVDVRVVHDGRDLVAEVAASLTRDAPYGIGAGHRWSGAPGAAVRGRRPDFGAVSTGRNSDLHTKLVLFSATRDPAGGLREHVTWWSSANVSHHSGMQKANNAVAVYGDRVLHDGLRTGLWDLMWDGVHFSGNDFYDCATGRGAVLSSPALRTKVFCSPQQTSDLWVGRLASVVVTPETEVVLVHARFTDDRLPVTDELVRIVRAGGRVRVLAGDDPDFLGVEVAARLLAAGVELRRVNTHDKLGLLHTRHGVSRRPRKVVLSGSHNLNHDANYVNDEILVKTFDDDLYDDVLASHVEPLWAESTPYQPVTQPSVPTAGELQQGSG